MKKYEITNESINFRGVKLFRIRALQDFRDVKAGDLGGYIEKEENLSQYDYCWVYGNARVYGNAMVYGNADAYKDTHVLQIGAIGSRDDTTTFFRTKDKKIYVICGCFGGDIEKFEKAVEEVHKGTKHEKTYKLAIELAKLQIELED